jgi:hypothetical protein
VVRQSVANLLTIQASAIWQHCYGPPVCVFHEYSFTTIVTIDENKLFQSRTHAHTHTQILVSSQTGSCLTSVLHRRLQFEEYLETYRRSFVVCMYECIHVRTVICIKITYALLYVLRLLYMFVFQSPLNH